MEHATLQTRRTAREPSRRREEEQDCHEMAHILGRWSESAVRLAYHLTHDREAARDLSQEAFVKAIEALPTLDDPASGRVWFTRIVVNLCRDWLRRRAVERKALARLAADKATPGDDPARTAQHKETLERTRQALMALPLDYREALALVAVEGYAPQEAAGALGIAEGTLRWRMFEARKLLKEELGRQARPPEKG